MLRHNSKWWSYNCNICKCHLKEHNTSVCVHHELGCAPQRTAIPTGLFWELLELNPYRSNWHTNHTLKEPLMPKWPSDESNGSCNNYLLDTTNREEVWTSMSVNCFLSCSNCWTFVFLWAFSAPSSCSSSVHRSSACSAILRCFSASLSSFLLFTFNLQHSRYLVCEMVQHWCPLGITLSILTVGKPWHSQIILPKSSPSRPHLTNCSLGLTSPHPKWHRLLLAVFAGFINVSNTETDTQTDHGTSVLCKRYILS